MERDFILGKGHTMQCADDVLLSCTLETCMVLLINVTPINSKKKNKNKQKNIGSGVRLLALKPWVGYLTTPRKMGKTPPTLWRLSEEIRQSV